MTDLAEVSLVVEDINSVIVMDKYCKGTNIPKQIIEEIN